MASLYSFFNLLSFIFLNGQLDHFPAEFSPTMKKMVHGLAEKQETLGNLLDGNTKRLLDELLEEMNEESSLYSNDRFISGYILGTMVMVECFSEMEDALSKAE